MRLFAACLAILSILTAPVLAQGLLIPPDRIAAAEDISREEWFGMVSGKTVTYKIQDHFWARETYDPTGNRVSIALADGKCMEGIWMHIENQFCFAWEDRDFVCFRHARSDGEILIIPMDGGYVSGDIQVVQSIDYTGLPCGPDLTS